MNVIAVAQLIEAYVATQAKRFRRGTYRAGDEPWLVCGGKLASSLPRELRSEDIEIVGLIREAEFRQHNRRPLETIRFEDVRASFKVVTVNVQNPFGVR